MKTYRIGHVDGRTVYFAWAPTSATVRNQLVLSTQADLKVTTIKGQAKKAKKHAQGKLIDLYNEPVIIEVPPEP